MAGATTWLHGQRKTELVELADKVGLKDYDNLKKADLETALDDHMRANQSSLAKDKQFNEYYKRIGASPGAAKTTGKEVAVTDTKTPKRRTKKDEDPKISAGTSTAVSRTPGASLLPTEVPLPPSPAVIAGHIDRQTARARASLQHMYARSGVVERVDAARAAVSTSGSLELLAIGLELWGLRPELLPFRYVTTVRGSAALGTGDVAVKAPDLFALLSGEFWSVFLTWLLTSVLLPLGAAYFFNLTLKARSGGGRGSRGASAQPALEYDPLTFNVAKGLITYLVYAYNVTLLDCPSEESKLKIEQSIPGGYQGVLIATGIGALASLYEAVLKK